MTKTSLTKSELKHVLGGKYEWKKDDLVKVPRKEVPENGTGKKRLLGDQRKPR